MKVDFEAFIFVGSIPWVSTVVFSPDSLGQLAPHET